MSESFSIVHEVCTRTGMYVAPATFRMVVAYLNGYNDAIHGGLLQGFREWLIVRANGGNNSLWHAIIPHIILPDADDPNAAIDESEANNARAIQMLETLFNEFSADLEQDGLRGVFHAYEKWLSTQSWYDESSPQFLP